MDADKQRIAIAESVGLIEACDLPPWSYRITCGPSVGHYKTEYLLTVIPQYTRDLNAMHEVEDELGRDEWNVYSANLFFNTKSARDYDNITWCITHATAAQRAEAYLKTKGLWEDNDE